MQSRNMDFAALGEIFNDATTRMVGGIGPQNRTAILRDIDQVQRGLTNLVEHNPGQFDGVAAIHAQNIIDQLNLERQAIGSLGTDPFAAKYINDVQRDLIDIVQGDDTLAALATAGGRHGFSAVPDLLAPPAQFQGNAEQTAFMRHFADTAADLAGRATALAEAGGDPAAVAALTGEIQAFGQEANAFTLAQGGVYSARFNNEFAAEGVHGTASRALIEGLQTGNVGLVRAAADVIAANAQDVAGNMLGIGDDPPELGNGIPAVVNSVALAGTVFNDATTKLVGGVYDGNRQSIHDDLVATRTGIQSVLMAGELDGRSEAHAQKVVNMLGRELAIVDNPDAGAGAAASINKLHSGIIGIVQGDAQLAALAGEDGATGFMALPATRGGNGQAHGNAQCVAQSPGDGGQSQHGGMALGGHPDPMAHIFVADQHHHIA